jgi:hypothetical protein
MYEVYFRNDVDPFFVNVSDFIQILAKIKM